MHQEPRYTISGHIDIIDDGKGDVYRTLCFSLLPSHVPTSNDVQKGKVKLNNAEIAHVLHVSHCDLWHFVCDGVCVWVSAFVLSFTSLLWIVRHWSHIEREMPRATIGYSCKQWTHSLWFLQKKTLYHRRSLSNHLLSSQSKIYISLEGALRKQFAVIESVGAGSKICATL